jgi:hypothetical protein
MLQVIDSIKIALTQARDDRRLASRVAVSRRCVKPLFILLCGATVFPLALPGGRAGAEPLAIEVAAANASFSERGGEPVVNIRLTSASKSLFADFTTRHQGEWVEVRVDGHVIMKPRVREPILGGTLEFNGGLTAAQAKDMASRLSSGAGKLEVEAVSR